MRRSLLALRIAVIAGAVGLVVALATSRPVDGTPGAAPQERDDSAAPPALTCDGPPGFGISMASFAMNGIAYLEGVYRHACPGKTTELIDVGSGREVESFLDGDAALAAVDRPLTGAEMADARRRCDARQLPFVAQPVRIHYRLPLADDLYLDAPALAKIFGGAVTRWDDPAIAALNPGVALPALPITVVGWREESTINAVFQRYLRAAGGWTTGDGPVFTGRAAAAADSDIDVLSIIENTDGAIGYVLAPDGPRTDVAFLDGVSPTLNAVGATVVAAMPPEGLVLEQEKLSRPPPAEGAYPVVIISYAVFCADDVAARDFLRAALIMPRAEPAYLLPIYEWGKRYRAVLQ